jgi:hypothetical protein
MLRRNYASITKWCGRVGALLLWSLARDRRVVSPYLDPV